MNKPHKPKPPAPPAPPKLVERTTIKPIRHKTIQDWNLKALIDKLTDMGVTDLSQVMLSGGFDENDGETLVTMWVELLKQTQTDEEWAITSAKNEAEIQSYRDRLANYQAAEAAYPAALAAWEAEQAQAREARERQLLADLQAKYPHL